MNAPRDNLWVLPGLPNEKGKASTARILPNWEIEWIEPRAGADAPLRKGQGTYIINTADSIAAVLHCIACRSRSRTASAIDGRAAATCEAHIVSLGSCPCCIKIEREECSAA
jgi:hypothetical protein